MARPSSQAAAKAFSPSAARTSARASSRISRSLGVWVRLTRVIQDSVAASKRAENAQEQEKAFERIENNYSAQTLLLARRLGEATDLETHITILGSLVRGGTPTAADRLLANQLAEWSVKMAVEGQFGRMACRIDGSVTSVPLDQVAG